jgi:hypothetical protein
MSFEYQLPMEEIVQVAAVEELLLDPLLPAAGVVVLPVFVGQVVGHRDGPPYPAAVRLCVPPSLDWQTVIHGEEGGGK